MKLINGGWNGPRSCYVINLRQADLLSPGIVLVFVKLVLASKICRKYLAYTYTQGRKLLERSVDYRLAHLVIFWANENWGKSPNSCSAPDPPLSPGKAMGSPRPMLLNISLNFRMLISNIYQLHFWKF